jgi:hypothetical protein
MTTILKNLVSKTATVASAKLITPADRIGLGLVVATYPAEILSFGQFPLPACPANPGGLEQALSAELMREHQAMATAEPPASSVGRVPVSSAPSWSKRPARSRASFPAAYVLRERIGDCQSPDRRDDLRAAMSWEATPTTAAAI